MLALFALLCGSVSAQDAEQDFAAAESLLPETTAGVVLIPDLPKFCESFKATNMGQLMEEESLQPFIDAQRERARNSLESIGNKVGIRPEDLYNIASGQVAVAWLPFEKDKRRPFSICVISDIRGNVAQAETAAAQIDKDLIDGGASRKDLTHRGQQVRVYTPKPKPGQLKIEEIALAWDQNRMIASDRTSVITDLLDAIAGEPATPSLSDLDDYRVVSKRVHGEIDPILKATDNEISFQWFARPFQMIRILRDLFNVDRGQQVDILKLLENQGFDVVKAAGGAAAMDAGDFDLLHRGFIYAPLTEGNDERFEKAANMLHFINRPAEPIPGWVHSDIGTFFRLNWEMERAFWAAETLVDEAFGEPMFRPMINDIRDDEEGPQIDIAKNVVPNFDNQLILLGDNTQPAAADSERMLVAIRVKNAAPIANAIRKTMEAEPDAVKLDTLPGVDIWRVQRGQGDDDLDPDIFSDLGFDEEFEEEEAPPLLDHWAIALVDKGPGSEFPWLMFSSHPDLLIQTAKRIQQGNQDGLANNDDVKDVITAMKKIGATDFAIDRIARPSISLRAKYELLRAGELKDSDSVTSTLLRRMFEDQENDEFEPIDTSTLPPMEKIEKYLRPAGGFMETVEDGWKLNGFLLK